MTQLFSIVAVLLAAILAIRGLRKPGLLLGLMWSTYAIEQVVQSGLSFFLARAWITNVALGGLTLMAITRAFLSGKMKSFSLTNSHVLIGLLLLQCVLSYAWSIDQSDTAFILKKNVPYILAFALLAPFCALTSQQVDNAIKVIVYYGAFLLLALAVSNYGARGVILELASGKLVEANPLAAATFGGYVSICSLFYLYARRDRSLPHKAFYIGIALLGVYIIIRSGSRGQLISLILSSFLWLPITAKVAAKRSSIIAILITGIIAFSSWYVISNSTSYRWDVDTVSDAGGGRIQQTIFVVQSMANAGPLAWLFGLGNSASYSLIGGYPHNVPGEVLAEEGLVGFALYVSFMVSVTLTGMRYMRKSDAMPEARVSIGVMLALFTFEFCIGLKQGSFIGSPAVLGVGLCIVNGIQMMKRREASTAMKRSQALYLASHGGGFEGSH